VEYWVKVPPGAILPTLLVPEAVNQIVPSPPVVTQYGEGFTPGTRYSVMVPAGEIFAMLWFPSSPNQIFPSGPRATP